MNQSSQDVTLDAYHEARYELAKRELSRRNFLDFVKYTFVDYSIQKFHHELCNRLEDVANGLIDRFMVFMPPRHGKSELISRRFAPWYIGKNPENSFMEISYNDSLAQSFGRAVRTIMADRRYRLLFPEIEIDPRYKANNRWALLNKTDETYIAAGIRGTITGRGANIIAIDDPIKSIAEANSARYRDSIWESYRTDIRSRLEEPGAIILVMTRWHQDDLAGRLLEAMDIDEMADQWVILNNPAFMPIINETPIDYDDSNTLITLWPDKFPVEWMLKTRKSMGLRNFESLYMGNPRPPEGAVFKREWFKDCMLDNPPVGVRRCRVWDLAATESTQADKTVGAKCSRIPKDNLFVIEHIVSGRWEWPKARKIINETAKIDGQGVIIGIENVGMQKALYQMIREDLMPFGFTVRPVSHEKDKYTNALPLASYAEQGLVKIVRGPWNMSCLDELCNFTGEGDEEDDIVDAVAGGLRVLMARIARKEITPTNLKEMGIHLPGR